MCSIYGAYGPDIDLTVLERIVEASRDRGRDGGGYKAFKYPDGYEAILGSHRATPTTEDADAPGGVYGRIVHNGTIANDIELGNPAGRVDSAILPEVLDLSTLKRFAQSLEKIKGSYAIAAAGRDGVYIAANYKPIYTIRRGKTIYWSSMERHLHNLVPFGLAPARLEPYSTVELRTGEKETAMRDTNNRALIVASAGLDSTTVAWMLKDAGYEVKLLHFQYGCKAEGPEEDRIEKLGEALGAPVTFLPINYENFKGKSPLLNDEIAIAEGAAGAEFASEWVPARNLVMLAHATAYAEANGFTTIALGNNLEESGAFPDNEEEFTYLFNGLLDYAVHDGGCVHVVSPVGHLMKHEIVAKGLELGVPYDLTWSCYHDGEKHCGNCGPCFMRKEAFARNQQKDPVFA